MSIFKRKYLPVHALLFLTAVTMLVVTDNKRNAEVAATQTTTVSLNR